MSRSFHDSTLMPSREGPPAEQPQPRSCAVHARRAHPPGLFGRVLCGHVIGKLSRPLEWMGSALLRTWTTPTGRGVVENVRGLVAYCTRRREAVDAPRCEPLPVGWRTTSVSPHLRRPLRPGYKEVGALWGEPPTARRLIPLRKIIGAPPGVITSSTTWTSSLYLL